MRASTGFFATVGLALGAGVFRDIPVSVLVFLTGSCAGTITVMCAFGEVIAIQWLSWAGSFVLTRFLFTLLFLLHGP
jgi:hypothetical protein